MQTKSRITAYNQALLQKSCIENSKRAGKKRSHNDEAKEYMQSEHTYTMKRGDDMTPITCKMLGRAAKLQNSLNVIKYHSGEHKRLIMWIWKKEEVRDE